MISHNRTYKTPDRTLFFLSKLQIFLQNTKAAGRTLANLSPNEIAALRQIAEDPDAGLAAQKAQNTLCFHYGICYDENGNANPKSNAPPKPPRKADKEQLLSKLNTSEVYPSPADGYATIEYSFLHAMESTVLNIYDNLGRIVYTTRLGKAYQGQELIDTRDFVNGLYILEISQDNAQVEVNKFVVTH